jgi:hypothetical protein
LWKYIIIIIIIIIRGTNEKHVGSEKKNIKNLKPWKEPMLKGNQIRKKETDLNQMRNLDTRIEPVDYLEP